jgi:hypothetical protein
MHPQPPVPTADEAFDMTRPMILASLILLLALPAPAIGRESNKFSELPAPVQARLLILFGGEVPADPGENFQDFDFGPEGLPTRRIEFWQKRKYNYFVYYVHGGYSKHSHLVSIQYSPGEEATPGVNVTFYGRVHESIKDVERSMAKLEFYSPDRGGPDGCTHDDY